ncbi:MAG: AAA family ATPase [Candidatus Aenigmarchaeota archaeon]|nr:AAA family ATPase [Candidatus Aenigmarchaeota archaeon]
MRLILVGLKGSGKTTVLNYVTKKGPNIKIFNAGNYFLEILEKRGLKRDEFDLKVKSEEYINIQKKVFGNLAKDIKKHKNVIVDTHSFLTKKEGYYPGLPLFAVEKIKPNIIVVLDYDPEAILKRRMKDLKEIGRERSAELTLEGVMREQEVQMRYSFIASSMSGATLKILKRSGKESHDFEHAEKNAEEILKLFD